MKKTLINRLTACLLALAMCAALLPVGIAEGATLAEGEILEGPVEEMGAFELSDESFIADEPELIEDVAAAAVSPQAESQPEEAPRIEEAPQPEEAPQTDEAPQTEEASRPEEEARSAEATQSVEEAETETVETGEIPTSESLAVQEADALAAAKDVSGFQLNAASLQLGVKETYALTAALDGKAVSKVSYKSSDTSVVTVTSKGKLTAKKAGSAVVTATSGSYAASCSVQVIASPSKVTLSASKVELGAGERFQLNVTIEPKGAVDRLTWKTSKAAVAKVDANGCVTAVAKGSATITATAVNGKKATCKVTVKAAPTAIAIGVSSVKLSVGQTYVPAVKVTGGAAEYTLSTNTGAVSVSGGTLTAVKAGSAVVTASTYNGLTAALKVTVVPAPRTMTLPQATYAIGVKSTLTLKPVFDADVPANLTYKSSDAKVAPVTEGGVVTGKKAGKATITVTTHNGLTASCAVQVFKAPSKVTLNATSLTLGDGETFQLEGKLPENSMSGIAWKSDHPNIASVDDKGLVTALAKGTAKITATTDNGKKATCKVKVNAQPKKLTLSKEALILGKGDTGELTWALDTGEGEVDLAIADTDIAQITKTSKNKITIKAKAVGKTTLTASTYNGLTATADITVTPQPTYLRLPTDSVDLGVGQTYTIVPGTDAGGVAALTFTTSSKSVATVSADGVVTAVKAGSATITVKTANKLTAKLKVKVTKVPTSIKVSPTSLTLDPYDYHVLKVELSKGTSAEVSYTSSDPSVAYVSQDGVVTGIRGGKAVITVATYNGLTATCKVTVNALDTPPDGPDAAKLKTVNGTTLEASWRSVSHAAGYNVYVGRTSDPDEAMLYGSYDNTVTSATIRGVTAGTIWHVFITAYNEFGESDLSGAAHALAKTPSRVSSYTPSLNYSGSIMLSVGSAKDLTVTVSPSGYRGDLKWESSSGAVSLTELGGTLCRVDAVRAGSGRVSVVLDNGMSASLYVRVVDTADLSEANFTAVQKAVLKEETLMDEDQGGNVIWDMISAKLVESEMPTNRVSLIVDKVKSAETLFRDLFVYSMDSYDIDGDAVKDKRGMVLGVTQFLTRDNTLYLVNSTSNAESYASTFMHEAGHGIDFNGEYRTGLSSENDAATEALLSDVRQVLLDRMDDAIASAGVSAKKVDADKVVDALLDYRTLLNEETVLSNLSSDEKKVYTQLTRLMASEMNSTLPMNNGSMVWDAIEGATNFAISGRYGHGYLLNNEQYKEEAKYYFYDKKGNATITAEPWAEYFSANIMQDAATIAVNLAYLPQTCKYFAETLAPKLLDTFKSLIKSK